MTDEKGKLARWRPRLSRFDYEIVHQASIKYEAPEDLSCSGTAGKERKTVDEGVPLMMVETNGGQPDTVCYL